MNRLRAYLQLMRFPAVFSAVSNVMMAYLIAGPDGEFDLVRLLLMVIVSSCFYLAGMVFNDVFDSRIDAIERPNRPIPSGRVTRTSAILLGGSLFLCGMLILLYFGLFSLQIGLLLVVCVLLYDGLFNKTFLGPLFMGGCRVLNLLMAATAHVDMNSWSDLTVSPLREIVIAVGIYILGLTWFAQFEALTSEQMKLRKKRVNISLCLAIHVIYLGLMGIGVFASRFSTLTGYYGVAAFIGYVLVVSHIIYHSAEAFWTPSRELIQLAVKTMLQSIVMIDAFVILMVTGNLPAAAVTLLLLLPARYLGRWIFIT